MIAAVAATVIVFGAFLLIAFRMVDDLAPRGKEPDEGTVDHHHGRGDRVARDRTVDVSRSRSKEGAERG